MAYEPNSLGGGSPSQAGGDGYVSFREPIEADKMRGKPERFADHFTQATLFWNSQSEVEKAHIVGAFRFELSRVETRAIRERVVSMLANVADALASEVAKGLGMQKPTAQPRVLERPVAPEVETSPALSLFARPGDGTIRARRVAVLVDSDVDVRAAKAIHAQLAAAGAAPAYVATRLGTIETVKGDAIEVEASFEAKPAVLFDALALPGGARDSEGEGEDTGDEPAGQLLEFIQDQYRHCKPILALGSAKGLLDRAGIPLDLPRRHARPRPAPLRSRPDRRGTRGVLRGDRAAPPLRPADGSAADLSAGPRHPIPKRSGRVSGCCCCPRAGGERLHEGMPEDVGEDGPEIGLRLRDAAFQWGCEWRAVP